MNLPPGMKVRIVSTTPDHAVVEITVSRFYAPLFWTNLCIQAVRAVAPPAPDPLSEACDGGYGMPCVHLPLGIGPKCYELRHPPSAHPSRPSPTDQEKAE